MPLIEAIQGYANKKPIRFHTPGHKGKNPYLEIGELLGQNIFSWDLTEIEGLDDLFDPTDAIKKAQDLLSDLYGAYRSFFLVNGTTSGIIGMMTSVLKPGDKVLIPRNCHTSIISGLIITGAIPIYLQPEKCDKLGVYAQILPETVEKALDKNPDAKALILVNPSYQGFCSNLEKIVSIARKRGIFILVDEAHGPHFALNPRLPASAGNFDVDIWVQSPHKMLSSFTQSAWLHTKGKRVDKGKLKEGINLNTSTSPSYILMASLDMTRALMQEKGEALWDGVISISDFARCKINEKTCFYCVDKTIIGKYGIYDIDPCRLMVNVSSAGFTGFEVDKILREKFLIYPEYADYFNVYFLITYCNSKQDMIKLIKALTYFKKREYIIPRYIHEVIPKSVLSPREVFFTNSKSVVLDKSCDMVASDAIIPYPPGVPLIMPGEIIQKAHINIIKTLVSAGGNCRGLKNGYISVIEK